MLFGPKVGKLVQLWYAKQYAHLWPLHGRIGPLCIVGTGKPRNHGVEIDGRIVVVPTGNLREPKQWQLMPS